MNDIKEAGIARASSPAGSPTHLDNNREPVIVRELLQTQPKIIEWKSYSEDHTRIVKHLSTLNDIA